MTTPRFRRVPTLTRAEVAPPLTSKRAPEIVLATLDGGQFNSTASLGRPVLFNVYDPTSGFSTCLWQCNQSIDELIKRAGPKGSPLGTAPSSNLVFLSYDAAALDVAALSALINGRLDALNVTDTVTRAEWAARLFFATAPATDAAPLAQTLSAWPTTTDEIVLSNGTLNTTLPRLDPRYDWIGWAFDPSQLGGPLPLAYLGDGCVDLATATLPNLVGQAALVFNETSYGAGHTTCSYFRMVETAMATNASALIVVASPGLPPIDMNCEGAAQCNNVNVGLPATMVGATAGQTLYDAINATAATGSAATVTFVTVVSRGRNAGISAAGDWIQTWGGSGAGATSPAGGVDGNPGDPSCLLYPRMSFLAWAGRFEIYRQALAANVAARPAGSVSLTLFRNESIRPLFGNCYATPPWGCGPSIQLEVPPLPYQGSLQLDLALGCAGDTDVTCEQWDYVVQLRACCIPTGLSAAGAVGVRGGPQCDAQSGGEIGRWITSFSRGIGRWHTDVTTLAPVLTGRWCNFTMYTVPWEGNQGLIPWIATLSLVMLTVPPPPPPPPPPMPPMPPMLALPMLAPWATATSAPATSATATSATASTASAASASAAIASATPPATSLASASTAGVTKGTPAVYQPWGAVSSNLGGIESVFQWIFFNQSYNTLFPPFAFSVPNGSRVLLMATISGHGNDNNGCGEFCATEHRFSVNAQPAHVKRQLLPITDPQVR